MATYKPNRLDAVISSRATQRYATKLECQHGFISLNSRMLWTLKSSWVTLKCTNEIAKRCKWVTRPKNRCCCFTDGDCKNLNITITFSPLWIAPRMERPSRNCVSFDPLSCDNMRLHLNHLWWYEVSYHSMVTVLQQNTWIAGRKFLRSCVWARAEQNNINHPAWHLDGRLHVTAKWKQSVSMAGERQDHWQGAGKGGRRFQSPPCFFPEFTYVFLLSVSMKEVASEHPFTTRIYMDSYFFQFISFCVLSCQKIFNIQFFTYLTL